MPPVLKGATLLGVEEGSHHTTFVFSTRDGGIKDGVIRIKALVTGHPLYLYTTVDRETGTLTHYRGTFGDPSKDEITDIKGLAR